MRQNLIKKNVYKYFSKESFSHPYSELPPLKQKIIMKVL